MRVVIPLRRRPIDLVLSAFFAVNLFLVVYLIDIEQIAVDPAHPEAALWPPAPMVRLIHWFGHTYDPALIAREAYWRGGIWVDVLFFGPFYAAALFAYVRGREWIRIPTLMWATSIMTSTGMIVFEELWGRYPAPHLHVTAAAYGPYLLVPLLAIARMAFAPHPFTEEAPA